MGPLLAKSAAPNRLNTPRSLARPFLGLTPPGYCNVARFSDWVLRVREVPGADAQAIAMSPASRTGFCGFVQFLGLTPPGYCNVARFAGWVLRIRAVPGADAQAIAMSPASRAGFCGFVQFLGLTPRLLQCRPLRGLGFRRSVKRCVPVSVRVRSRYRRRANNTNPSRPVANNNHVEGSGTNWAPPPMASGTP